jgi:hypothetical protein
MNRLMVARLTVDGFPLNVERSRRFMGILHGRKTVAASHEPAPSGSAGILAGK